MKYRFCDGYEFEAGNPDEICTAIWKSMKFALRADLQEWMDSNAKVMKNMAGYTLRTDSTEHHVEDMLRYGVIEPVES